MKGSRRFLLVLTCILVAMSCFAGVFACSTPCEHTWGEWTTATPAGCETSGTEQRECSLCQETETRPIQATGHDYGEWIDADSEAGTVGHYQCASCQKYFDSEHNELDSIIDTPVTCQHDWAPATCTTPKTCLLCGDTEGGLGEHVWGEWTSNGDGTHTRVCETNDQHVENGDCEGGNATCTDKAVCDICETAYGELGEHVWGEWTSNGDGTHSRVCETNDQHVENGDCEGGNATCTDKAVCDICETAYGNLAQHVWGEWTSNGDGTHTRVCETNDQHTENGTCEGGNATCTDKAVCDICDSAYGELGEHVWGAWTSNGDGTHTRVCETNDQHVENGTCEGGNATCTDKAVCDICDSAYGELGEHVWGEWTSNGDGTHTRVCETNDEHVENGTCEGGNATCTDKAVCDICDSAYGELGQHVWGDWTSNGDGTHTRVCETNDQHTEDGNCEGGNATCTDKAVCDICETAYGELGQHVWGEWTSNGDGTHTRVCETNDEHTENGTCEGGNATCTDKAVCDICDTAYGELGQHVWGEWTSNGDGTHTRVCETNDEHVENGNCEGGNATCTDKAVCDICETAYGELGEHAWSAWTSNGDGTHTRVCETNDQHVENGTCEGGNATCTDKAVCDICETAYGELGQHVWGEWTSNGNGTHTRVCETNDEHVENGNCEGGNATCTDKAVCDICDTAYGELAQHVWGEWTSNGNGTHTRVCETNDEHVENGTCEGGNATCTDKAVCDICETAYGDFGEHAWGAWTSNGDGTHSRYCTKDQNHEPLTEDCSGGETDGCTDVPVCDTCHEAYGEAVGHAWDEGVLTEGELCTDDGTIVYTCGTCGETKSETVAGHDHDFAEPTVVDPTCVEPGYTLIECLSCDYSVKQDETPALGEHEWDAEPTCTTGASCVYGCGATLDPLGHDYYEENSLDATCEEDGKLVYACSRCSEGGYEVVTDHALGHDFTGKEAYEVLREGHDSCYYTEVIDCARCGVPVHGKDTEHHKYTGKITTAATCQAEGEMTLTCEYCGGTKTESIDIDLVTGHAWDEGTLDTETSIRTHTCSLCSKTKTAFDASASTTAGLTADQLAATGEVQLSEVAMSLDDTTKGILSGEVNLSAEVLADDDLEAAKAKLGDKVNQLGTNQKIFNFTLEDETGLIKDFEDAEGNKGYITITIPYKLATGEDVDNIAVWFLDGDTPVSIKATYNNGYVTFQTSHFSTYTVTKLTPAERCALHGHEDATLVEEGSCIKDAYTLTVCKRCGRTEKVITNEADGHDIYVVGEQAATCVEDGYIERACRDCDYTSITVLPKTGHKYGEGAVTEATCYSAGSITYHCESCDSVKVIGLPKVLHTKETEIVNATCDTQGYIRTYCTAEGCDYEQITVTEPALGHEWNATFVWAEVDGEMTAVLVVTCANDNGHVEEIVASITAEEIEASCVSAGAKRYIAKASFNGEGYQEVKIVNLGTASHTEASHFNEVGHWTQCQVCGEILDAAEHVYGEPEVILAPTCAEAGESKVSCECGYEATVVIPATGEHVYENGACIGCGREEVNCDHTLPTAWTEVDVGALGACGGYVKIKTCDCGERTEFNYDSMNALRCDFQQPDYEMGTTPDGKPLMHMVQSCANCPIKLYIDMTQEGSGCIVTIEMNMTAVIDGVTVMENAYCKTVQAMHHGSGMVEVDLAKYGACGGMVETYVCGDCGEITQIGRMGFACELAYGDPEVKTDENGNTVYCMTGACSECGMVVDQEMWMVTQGCYETTYGNIMITMGDTVVLEAHGVVANRQDNHEFVTTVTKDGDTCEDGWTIRRECTICGSWQEDSGEGHCYELMHFSADEINGNAGEQIVCPGTVIVYRRCLVCDLCELDGQPILGCQNSTDEQGQYELDGVMHMTNTTTCTGCGMVTVNDVYNVAINACQSAVYAEITITAGDKTLLDIKAIMATQGEHSYEQTFTPMGDTCDDGIIVTNTCTVCGDSNSYETRGCTYEMVEMYLDGACDPNSSVMVERCIRCGDVNNVMNAHFHCPDIVYEPTTEYTDGDGRMHIVNTTTCATCGISYVRDSSYEQVDACNVKVTETTTLHIGEKEIINATTNYGMSQHDYVYTPGEGDCATNLLVYVSCKNCDYSEEQWVSEHACIVETEINSETHEICEQTRFSIFSCMCGKESRVEYGFGCNANHEILDNGAEYRKCLDCGLEMTRTWYSETEGCYVYNYVNMLLVLNGETIMSVNTSDGYSTNHDSVREFRLFGESCLDGYEEYEYCKTCGYEHTHEPMYEHWTYVQEEYTAEELGICYGWAKVSACPCGEVSSSEVHGCWTYVNDNSHVEGDWKVSVYVYRCDTCNTTYTETIKSKQDVENCLLINECQGVITRGDELILSCEWDSVEESHSTVSTYTLMEGSKTCEDGVNIHSYCTQCDWYSDSTTYDHYMGQVEVINHAECGATCNGKTTILACACVNKQIEISGECDFGEESTEPWVEGALDETYFDMLNSGHGLHTEWTVKTCAVTDPSCKFAIRTAYYWLLDPDTCIAYQYQTVQFGYNAQTGEYVAERTVKTGQWIAYHVYEETYEELENGGSTLTRVCSKCDARTVETSTVNDDGSTSYRQEFTSSFEKDELARKLVLREAALFEHNGETHDRLVHEREEVEYRNGEVYWTDQEYSYEFDYNEHVYEEGGNETVRENYTSSHNEPVEKVITTTYYNGQAYETYYYEACGDNVTERITSYDFAEKCTAYVTETINGETTTRTEDACFFMRWDYQKVATCTQSGLYAYYCQICDYTIEEAAQHVDPLGHDWCWQEDSQMYVCSRCDLLNANGADGEVVLENLTEERGAGINYVVGYWNKGNVEYIYNIAIVVTDASGNTTDVILDDVFATWYTGEYEAAVFSKAEVERSAGALGYEAGTYEVKFTFVPMYGDGLHDYAITL